MGTYTENDRYRVELFIISFHVKADGTWSKFGREGLRYTYRADLGYFGTTRAPIAVPGVAWPGKIAVVNAELYGRQKICSYRDSGLQGNDIPAQAVACHEKFTEEQCTAANDNAALSANNHCRWIEEQIPVTGMAENAAA